MPSPEAIEAHHPVSRRFRGCMAPQGRLPPQRCIRRWLWWYISKIGGAISAWGRQRGRNNGRDVDSSSLVPSPMSSDSPKTTRLWTGPTARNRVWKLVWEHSMIQRFLGPRIAA